MDCVMFFLFLFLALFTFWGVLGFGDSFTSFDFSSGYLSIYLSISWVMCHRKDRGTRSRKCDVFVFLWFDLISFRSSMEGGDLQILQYSFGLFHSLPSSLNHTIVLIQTLFFFFSRLRVTILNRCLTALRECPPPLVELLARGENQG